MLKLLFLLLTLSFFLLLTLSLSTYTFSQRETCKNILVRSLEYFEKEQLDSVIIISENCLKKKDTHDFNSFASIMLLRSQTFQKIGLLDRAYKCSTLPIVRAINNQKKSVVIGKCYNQLGIILSQLDQPEKALNKYYMAEKIFLSHKEKYLLALTYSNIALYHERQKEDRKAIVFQFNALKEFGSIGDSLSLSSAYNNLGIFYANLEMVDSAMYYCNLAASVSEAIGDSIGISYALINLGRIRGENNDLVGAKNAFQSALQLSLKLNDVQSLITIYKNLREVNNSLENYPISVAYGDSLLHCQKEMWSKNLQSEISRQEIIYRIDKILDSKLLLESENRQQAQELNYRKIIIVMMSITSVLIILFLFYLIRQGIRLKRNNRNLLSKNKSLMNLQLEFENFKAQKEKKYSNSSLVNEEIKPIYHEVLAFMTESKSYLDPHFKLDDLAVALNINRSYLSQAVNQCTDMNFSNFMNKMRIEECQKRIMNNEFSLLSIEGIAKESGFNSKSAFNSAFKKFTGLTPSYYLSNWKQPFST